MALQVIFSGAGLILCAFFFVYFHLYIKRRTNRDGILAGYQEEVNRLIAEIDRATDRDAQLVEERVAALRKMLEDADRRIALLSRDLDRRRTGTELYTALGGRRPVPELLQPDTNSPRPSGEAPAAAPAVPKSPPSPNANPPPVRPLTERVEELARQGLAVQLIAARLGVSLSEVELALTVSRRQ